MDVNICPWGQDSEFEWITELPAGIDAALLTGDLSDPAGEEAWRLLWTLRRQLWRDLIPSDRLDVTFTHDHEGGEGLGPILKFSGPDGLAAGVRLVADDFSDSDTMHMDYGGGPDVFGWPEFELQNLEWKEFDSDLYEHSFGSRDRLAVRGPTDEVGASWGDVGASMQTAAVESVLRIHNAQLDEYEEIILETRDVLCAIAIHPQSSDAVARTALSADPLVRVVVNGPQ